ncbi:MAG: response regulator [Flavobacterium sp.]
MIIRILIVDDHPMTVDGYVNLLSEYDFGAAKPEFIKAHNCQEAYNKINIQLALEQDIDLALLDVSLPAFPQHNILDGVDVGLYLRNKMSDCKIIMQTMHSEPVKVDNIVKQLRPEGFISKNDINFEIFSTICNRIIRGENYFSPTILKAQQEMSKNNLEFDIHDNKILVLLAQGVKTINLPEYIPLSLSAIEKRKATIKDQLLQKKGSDLELLQKARQLGLL